MFCTCNYRSTVSGNTGNLLTEGDIIKLPKLADTFEKISQDPFSFYNGSLADDIVADIQEAGMISFETPTRKQLDIQINNIWDT